VVYQLVLQDAAEDLLFKNLRLRGVDFHPEEPIKHTKVKSQNAPWPFCVGDAWQLVERLKNIGP